MTHAIFRLSVQEINIDTECFLPRAFLTCVCWTLISLFSAQPLLFFLKNQTITDVVTETETLVLEGLSEQVRLGASVISPVCFVGVAPPTPGGFPEHRGLSALSTLPAHLWSGTKLLDKVPSFFYFTFVWKCSI